MTNHGWVVLVALGIGAMAAPAACGGSDTTFDEGAPSGGAGATGAGAAGACSVEGRACDPLLCDPGLGCVECTKDGDCGAVEPACVAGRCEQCGDNADCKTPGTACFPKDHTCQPACQSAASCNGDAPICDQATGACVGCKVPADCMPDAPICSELTKQCVECQKNGECGAAEPFCDLEAGKCRQCLLDGQCAAGMLCIDHSCQKAPSSSCGAGQKDCGPGVGCVDPSADPRHCGACNKSCQNEELCAGGHCECKPGLSAVDGKCVDLSSDPSHCGAIGKLCGGSSPLCQDGDCVRGCDGGKAACDEACVDLKTHPLHCGDCGKHCNKDEVCVDGSCESWGVGLGCASCPCNASCVGDFATCCTYPGAAVIICVEGGQCP
jgi:hypothetical protein